MSRYDGRTIYTNEHELWKQEIRKRGKKFILQFSTAELNHPTPEQINELSLLGHIWAIGDSFQKLGSTHYGDPEMWWIIAWFNQKPTDSHMKIGDTIYIPFPLEKLLQIYGL